MRFRAQSRLCLCTARLSVRALTREWIGETKPAYQILKLMIFFEAYSYMLGWASCACRPLHAVVGIHVLMLVLCIVCLCMEIASRT